MGSQNSRYSKASAKARAVGQFFKYLDWQYAIVRKRDIHTEEATSGASYVLNKIDACLKFYFTKEVMSSDDSDILDF